MHQTAFDARPVPAVPVLVLEGDEHTVLIQPGRQGGGGRKKAGCAVSRPILVIVWHLLNDRAARYRDLGSDWHARHTDRSRKARNARAG